MRKLLAVIGVLAGCGGNGTPGDLVDDPGGLDAAEVAEVAADAPPHDPGPDALPFDPGPGPDATDPGPFEWPLPTGPVAITPSAAWKNQVAWPGDPFVVNPYQMTGTEEPRWVKFTVLVRDPTKVYFQDGHVEPFHADFARAHLDPFRGLTAAQFDAVSLYEAGQEAILGAVLIPGGPDWVDDGPREFGIQLVRQDAYHPEMVRIVFDRVKAAVTFGEPLRAFYFPTFEQAESAHFWQGWLLARGIEISGPERWAKGNGCYAKGWTVGRLVQVPGAGIAQAYLDGTLRHDDILLTDAVPAEVPYVQGIVTTTPSTPNSHVAILAGAFGVPFAWAALPADRAAIEALVGKTVGLRVGDRYNAMCQVRAFDLSDIPAGDLAGLKALKKPAAVDFPARARRGAYHVSTEDLGPADVPTVGGKAANYGVIRDAIPANSQVALALTMDLFLDFLAQPSGAGTLGDAIRAKLSKHAWPPDVKALAADLEAVRAMVEDAPFPAPLAQAVHAAIADRNPERTLRFRSSTNVEDSATFTGAGLYDSFSGCPADDLDDDDAGPSACDASRPNERTVARAIRRVYASFWNQNAYLERLRRGVDESKVGMGVLVHDYFPDTDELANGVATLRRTGTSTDILLVTQAGAVSVANPSGGAVPEVVNASIYSFGSYLYPQQQSSLVPLGDHVMAWEDDYKALAALLDQVATRWAQATGRSAFVLDLEYKKMRLDGKPGLLSIKQVRELPDPTKAAPTPTYLVPGTNRWCTFQGEAGDLHANHRLKSRWAVQNRGAWTDDAALATSPLTHLAVEFLRDGSRAALAGAPADLPGTSWKLVENTIRQGMRWGAEAGSPTVELAVEVPRKAEGGAAPLVALDELWVIAEATHDTPVWTWGWDENWNAAPQQVTQQMIRLGECPPDEPPAGSLDVTRTTLGPDGLKVVSRFLHPAPPTGPTAGYTAPLVRWKETRIEGLTTEPVVLTDWWAQTYRPQHHNFSEDFLFEPRLDPGVPAATLAELEAADLRAVAIPWCSGPILAVRRDGTLQDLGTATCPQR